MFSVLTKQLHGKSFARSRMISGLARIDGGVASGPSFVSREVPKVMESKDILLDSIFSRISPLPYTSNAKMLGEINRLLPGQWPANQWVVGPVEKSIETEIFAMNRNARRPKRANHGARPCSRSSRRWKKEKIGNRHR